MAAKPRVHEIAAELGIDSKRTLEKLKDIGEFVKGPSSTVEPPVARKLKAAFAEEGVVPVPKDEQKKPAPKKAAPKPAAPVAPEATDTPESDSEPSEAPASSPTPGSTDGGGPSPASVPTPGIPRPGNNPFASSQGMGRPGIPRPGNNPYASSQGMGRPTPANARAGAERTEAANREAPSRGGATGNKPPFQQRPGGPGRPGGGGPPAGGPARPGGGGGGGPRGRGRGPGGGTAGAFGRGGSKSKSRKSKRTKIGRAHV